MGINMKKKKASLSADIAYMLFIIAIFCCVAFIVYSENTSYNIAALCIVFSVLIITHFTAVTVGLILNVLIMFAVFTFYLYNVITYGMEIHSEFYFWVLAGPVLTVISHIVFRNTQIIESENLRLRKRVQYFSIVDDLTELKNMQAYQMEFPVYQRIAARYEIGLMLIIWQFKYSDDLKKILGKTGMAQSAIELSKAMSETFRKEDVVYIMSKNPYEWGSLLLSNEDSEELLKERIKENIDRLDFQGILGKNAPKLEVRVGTYYTSQEDETALSMLEKAKKSLQYDV